MSPIEVRPNSLILGAHISLSKAPNMIRKLTWFVGWRPEKLQFWSLHFGSGQFCLLFSTSNQFSLYCQITYYHIFSFIFLHFLGNQSTCNGRQPINQSTWQVATNQLVINGRPPINLLYCFLIITFISLCTTWFSYKSPRTITQQTHQN